MHVDGTEAVMVVDLHIIACSLTPAGNGNRTGLGSYHRPAGASVQVNTLYFGANIPIITNPAKLTVVCPDGIELNAHSQDGGKKPVISSASKNIGRARPINIFNIFAIIPAPNTLQNIKNALFPFIFTKNFCGISW